MESQDRTGDEFPRPAQHILSTLVLCFVALALIASVIHSDFRSDHRQLRLEAQAVAYQIAGLSGWSLKASPSSVMNGAGSARGPASVEDSSMQIPPQGNFGKDRYEHPYQYVAEKRPDGSMSVKVWTTGPVKVETEVLIQPETN